MIRTEKRLAIDYDGNKLFNERITHRFDVVLDNTKHKKQLELYAAVTEYVRLGFNTAKKTKNTATGLIMILFQRLVSSSTSAILSAMQGRLERLQSGEDNGIEDYANEVDGSFEDMEDTIDFEGLYQSDHSGLTDEVSLLNELIKQAKDCINTETDAKADALLSKYKGLQQVKNNPELKMLIFTEFKATQKMLQKFFQNKGYRCRRGIIEYAGLPCCFELRPAMESNDYRATYWQGG
jgi:hypothetical protein